MVAEDLRSAIADIDGPLAVLDMDALRRNAVALSLRGQGLPIRVASKSVRVPRVISEVLSRPGFHGVLGYSLAEAIELTRLGITDIVVAYPTTDRTSLATLSKDAELLANITLMVDSVEHLDYLSTHMDPVSQVRLCLDIDGSLKLSQLHIGTRRSPIRTPADAREVAQRIVSPFKLVGLMCYEGQVAGVGNAGRGVKAAITRVMQSRSMQDLLSRRTEIVSEIRTIADLEFVNGGGTGSLEVSAAEGSLTELAAGSGLYAPALFDGYNHFRHEPALFLATPVVRRPGPTWVTVYQGGWSASGVAGHDRSPVVEWPRGLSYAGTEGAGEVQTPLHGEAADDLRLGDHVFFRHAKAGEVLEHFPTVTVVSRGQVIDTWATYRGHGWRF